LSQAKRAGKIAKSYEIPPAQRQNSPARIQAALSPLRESGLLPQFPFASDFTPLEQRLIGALEKLRDLPLSRLIGIAAAGLGTGEDDAVTRMNLQRPSTIGQFLNRALVRGALKS
jgi:hypothetical protein